MKLFQMSLWSRNEAGSDIYSQECNPPPEEEQTQELKPSGSEH